MKKLTAILLLLLTIGFIVFIIYVNKEEICLKSSNPKASVSDTKENIQGILPGGCIPQQESSKSLDPSKHGNREFGTIEKLSRTINRCFEELEDYSVPIVGVLLIYFLLSSILSLITVFDKTKKQMHSDEDYKTLDEKLGQIQAKLDESNKSNEELKKQLEANKVDSAKIKELQQNLDEAKKETEETKSNLENKTADFDKLKSETEAITSKAENLEKDNKGIRREIDKLNSKLNASSNEKDELKAKIIELTKQMEDQKEELKATAANAKGGKEAIPPAAYQILYLLQKEGRLIDLLNEDISAVEDEDLGGAVRPVLEGCAKLLKDRLVVEPVLKEEEGSVVTVDEADPETIKLSGSVPESGPYKGELIHHGWRLKECNLPELVDGWKGNVIAPAEIEIS